MYQQTFQLTYLIEERGMSKDYLKDVDKDVKPELKVGGRTCQCAGCSLYFTGVNPFDRHLLDSDTANPICRTPDEMLAIGMTVNKHGVWQMGTSKKQLDEGTEAA